MLDRSYCLAVFSQTGKCAPLRTVIIDLYLIDEENEQVKFLKKQNLLFRDIDKKIKMLDLNSL